MHSTCFGLHVAFAFGSRCLGFRLGFTACNDVLLNMDDVISDKSRLKVYKPMRTNRRCQMTMASIRTTLRVRSGPTKTG